MSNGRHGPARWGWWLGLALGWACHGDDGTGDAGSRDADAMDGDAVAEDAAEEEASEAGDVVDDPDDGGSDDGDEPTHCTPPATPCTTDSTTCQGPACHSPPFATSCVGGSVTDGAGAPLAYQGVALCAGSRCFFGCSDEDGWFAVHLPEGSSVDQLAVYFPSGGRRHSPFCRLQDLCDDAIHVCTEFKLYTAPTGGSDVGYGELAADVRVEAEDGAALVFRAGSEVLLPIEALTTTVALTRFPLEEHVPCFIDPANLPLALYAVTPMDTLFIEPGTMVTPVLRSTDLDLPNETGLAAGTVVDVYVIGGSHPQDAGLLEGEWRALTTATVTADGTRIRTAPGEGLGYLTWFGIYPTTP
ncbi:MAG: hypothetical protein HY825_16280 [Acidobacteria bacterium]|nr:hypothetical protein [Acidobacteriota bacterium]